MKVGSRNKSKGIIIEYSAESDFKNEKAFIISLKNFME